MKKYPIIFTTLILVLVLAACGGEAAGPETANTTSLNANYENALSAPAQLALGSIKLEDTDLAIDEEQASKLLPLWQGYLALLKSASSADAEINSLFKQIQNAMTAGQIKAISDMQLTDTDSTTFVEEMGMQISGGSGESGSTAAGTGGMGGPSGGMPGGGVGGAVMGGSGGGMPDAGMSGIAGGGAAPSEDASTTPAAPMEDGNSALNLINALIRTLQVKTGEIESSGTTN